MAGPACRRRSPQPGGPSSMAGDQPGQSFSSVGARLGAQCQPHLSTRGAYADLLTRVLKRQPEVKPFFANATLPELG